MATTIGGTGLNPGGIGQSLGLSGAYVLSVQARSTGREVYINGALDARSYAFHVSHGLDQQYAEATIYRTGGDRYPQPNPPDMSIGYWSDVEIKGGASNIATRFRGWVISVENDRWPQTNRLICKGKLYLAAWVKNEETEGTDLSENGDGQADEGQVRTVLAACGVSYSSGDIQGTGILMGSLFENISALADAQSEVLPAPTPFWWQHGETGLSYIQKLDEVSVKTDASQGRARTYESVDGTIRRQFFTGAPGGESEDYAFVEGQDILDDSFHITRDASGAANGQRVTGAIDPLGFPEQYTAETSFAPYMPSNVPVNTRTGYRLITAPEFSSPMIEKSNIIELGPPPDYTPVDPNPDVVSCEQVAVALLNERNGVRETVTFETPRDDTLDIGHTVRVTSPTLGILSLYWLHHLEIEYDERGVFTQRVTAVKVG